MPKLTIDGKTIEVAPGTRVIEAAKKIDVDAPYYCYHPGLSIAGNCRMCLVEVEKMPKLQIACHLQAAEGMVVRTNSEKVLKTRQHVLEFLLVNHPLDCPVCDQAGECWLQDYYMKHGLYDSRVSEDKIKKPKAVPIGPTVMLDAERCILCSRCVRFCDEISKTSELGMINRNDHSEISVFPGKELNNAYSGNVVDICPVGALTDRDFRFKMRVWYLKEKDSVCNGCSRGCNIQAHYNLDRPHHTGGAGIRIPAQPSSTQTGGLGCGGERVMRLKPRYNEQVNQWWMCDEGRYGYKYHDQNRILKPRRRDGAAVREAGWDEMLAEAAKKITHAGERVAVLASPQLSNEELFLIRELFRGKLNLKHIHLVSPHAEGAQDDFLIRADKNPNTRGAEALGFSQDPKALADLAGKISKGELSGLIVFGQDIYDRFAKLGLKADLNKMEWTLFIGPNQHLTAESSAFVFPSATHFEKEGTFTNFEGRIQKFSKVLEPLGEARPEWQIILELAVRLGFVFHYKEIADVFHELALREAFFQGKSYESLSSEGSDIRTMGSPTIPDLQQYDNIL